VLIVTVSLRLLLYVVVLAVMVLQYRQCDVKRWGEPLAWGSFAVHGVIYCIAFLIDYQDRIVNIQLFNYWAAAVQLHGLIILLAIEFARYRRLRGRMRGC